MDVAIEVHEMFSLVLLRVDIRIVILCRTKAIHHMRTPMVQDFRDHNDFVRQTLLFGKLNSPMKYLLVTAEKISRGCCRD